MASPDVDREPQLLAEGAALRRLARSLVGGHADAEDLVQDTLAASLANGRLDAGKRPWLSGTLRNLALFWRRSAARRAARERRAGASGPRPSGDPAVIAMQAEAIRDVAAAVHELEEPFRTVIVLRFWHGLLPEAIAERLGVPRNTVRSRLQRGLERLRARLDRTHGDRAGWLAALVPFADPIGLTTASAAGAAFSWTTGVLLMTKLQVTLATLALAAVGLFAWWVADGDSTPPAVPTAASDQDKPAAGTLTAPGADAVAAAGDPEARQLRVPITPAAGLTVTGTVTRAGSPCPDLELLLQWFDGMEPSDRPAAEHRVRSDVVGKFVWNGPVRTQVGTLRAARVRAASDMKISCTPQVVQPGQAEVALEVTAIALDRTLFGRVHDVAGAPIAGAELSVNGWPDVATKSDAEGRYELRVTGPPYPLLVVKAGYREGLFQSYIAEGKPRHELDIELEPGAMFVGRVVDQSGNAVAAAQVRASGLVGGAVTDAEGRFAFGGAAADQRHELTATKAGFQRTALVASPGGDPVELVLRPGLALAVRVIDGAGHGVAGARISVMQEPMRGMVVSGSSDAEGRLRIADLPPRVIDVVADKAGFVKARGQADVAKATGEFVLVLRPGRTIAGRVLDAAGAPIVGASVYCQRETPDIAQRSVGGRATSDPEGRFTIDELPPEPCTVTAHHADHRRTSLEGVGGTPTDLVVRMPPAASVAGRVLDGVTGAPVRAFTVVLVGDQKTQPLSYLHPVKFVDSNGWWSVKHWELQPGGGLFVEVWAEGYAPARVAGVARVDAPRDQHVIHLFAGTTVRGIVIDAATGAALPKVEVTLQSGDPKIPARRSGPRAAGEMPVKTRAHTDADGKFELLSVPPGENRLVLAHDEYPKRTFGPFEVAAGTPSLEVQPKLTPGATLRGRVTGLADAAGRRLSAHVFGAKTLETELGRDGSFELRGVGAGRLSLSLANGKGTSHSLRLEVGDDDIADIVFALPPFGTGSIRVTVVGQPHGRGSVETIGLAPGQCSTTHSVEYTNAGFVVGGLVPGSYVVEAFSVGGGSWGRAEVTVGDGEVAVTVDAVKR